MKKLKFAVLGCGFWSRFQIAGWMEMSEHVELVAVYNRTLPKAQKIADEFNVPKVYDDAEAMLNQEDLDFVDVITDVDTHAKFTMMAAQRGINVICQKPMSPDYETSYQMVKACRDAGVKFFVHENFRWQPPLRKFKEIMDSGAIGEVFKGRVTFCSGFPVFDNQPFLAELDQFILTDIGSHILDIVRFLFGEARNLQCKIKTVNPKIKGEDVANVFFEMENGSHCYAEMSYASILEKESFPETLVLAEGSTGSLKLEHDFVIKHTTRKETLTIKVEPPMYDWLDPEYASIHSAIVDTNRSFLEAFQQDTLPETHGLDNLKTIQLVFACYQSAVNGNIIEIPEITF